VSFPAKTREERREGAKAIATTVSQLDNKGTNSVTIGDEPIKFPSVSFNR